MTLKNSEGLTAVILAGGLGSRLAEETSARPKPMVEIGGKPILWHIMKHYSVFGVKKFVICLGYKGYMIKEYFANYVLHVSDIIVDVKSNSVQLVDNNELEDWNITLIDTGINSGTAERISKISHVLAKTEPFFLTYGDGVADINIELLYNSHLASNKLITVTAVKPPDRFGNLEILGNSVVNFSEKTQGPSHYISGGFFVVSPSAFDYFRESDTSWEFDILPRLTREHGIDAYLHTGFWQPMDTLRDKNTLEDLWETDRAPWKMW